MMLSSLAMQIEDAKAFLDYADTHTHTHRRDAENSESLKGGKRSSPGRERESETRKQGRKGDMLLFSRGGLEGCFVVVVCLR